MFESLDEAWNMVTTTSVLLQLLLFSIEILHIEWKFPSAAVTERSVDVPSTTLSDFGIISHQYADKYYGVVHH
jgi:hypothetical protein